MTTNPPTLEDKLALLDSLKTVLESRAWQQIIQPKMDSMLATYTASALRAIDSDYAHIAARERIFAIQELIGYIASVRTNLTPKLEPSDTSTDATT